MLDALPPAEPELEAGALVGPAELAPADEEPPATVEDACAPDEVAAGLDEGAAEFWGAGTAPAKLVAMSAPASRARLPTMVFSRARWVSCRVEGENGYKEKEANDGRDCCSSSPAALKSFLRGSTSKILVDPKSSPIGPPPFSAIWTMENS